MSDHHQGYLKTLIPVPCGADLPCCRAGLSWPTADGRPAFRSPPVGVAGRCRSLSGAGVRLAVARLQPLRGHVGVDLGGRGRGMPEDLLDAAQVRPALKEMGGRGVPDRVRAGVQGSLAECQAIQGCGLEGLGPQRPADALQPAWTMRRAVLGSRRAPRAPRNKADPLLAFASTGRPASAHRFTARTAGRPTGTTRSLSPLPRTRTVRRCASSPPVSSPHSSLTRIADA